MTSSFTHYDIVHTSGNHWIALNAHCYYDPSQIEITTDILPDNHENRGMLVTITADEWRHEDILTHTESTIYLTPSQARALIAKLQTTIEEAEAIEAAKLVTVAQD